MTFFIQDAGTVLRSPSLTVNAKDDARSIWSSKITTSPSPAHVPPSSVVTWCEWNLLVLAPPIYLVTRALDLSAYSSFPTRLFLLTTDVAICGPRLTRLVKRVEKKKKRKELLLGSPGRVSHFQL